MPDDLGRRLEPWIDVRKVGPDGFWLWLGSILALLPDPTGASPDPGRRAASPEARYRGLARDLVDCARERARLTVLSDQYYRDNRTLSLRLKAVEAALRTARGGAVEPPPPPDPDADEATTRYLPSGAPR